MALLNFIEVSDDEEIVVSKKDDEEIVDLSSDDETAEVSDEEIVVSKKDDEGIVDLSSDDETAEEFHNDFTYGNPGQHPTTPLHDEQAVFVAEGDGEARESGNANEATPSSSVVEKGSLEPTSISAKALTFDDFDANLLRVKVRRHRKLFHTDTPWRSPRLEDKNKGRGKSVEELAVDLKRHRMLEKQNTSATSQNCSHAPAAVTFPIPSPTSSSAKALTFESFDANLRRVEVKRRRKLAHNGERWRSPRLKDKNKCHNKSVGELAVDLKRSRMLEVQNTSARSKKKNKLSLCTQCRMCKEPLY